jgi:CHAT domain-containing protein
LYKAAVNLLFNTDGLTAKETNGRKLWPESRHGVMSLNYTDSSFSKAELPRLQNAFVEADAIGKILSCRPVKETGADSAKFYQMLEKSNIVHLIAHARIDNQDPLSAHIVLAGTDKQPHMLTSGQIYTMHNNASFVYLSACNTAQGILEGSEGMQSLARAFLYSGTHSLVMTLWSIPDLSAPAIAQNFYAMLKKGYSKPQAMRLAKLKYLEASPTNIGLQPVFWSAPVTIGSPAPLFVSSFFKGLAVFLLVPVLALTIWATNNFLHNKKK